MRSSKIQSIAYWATTGLMTTPLVAGGVVDILASPDAVAFLAHLGYPAYFARIIGVWKVAGGVAVLAPRLARLKEWAYAGIFFDLTGAVISHAASGDGAGAVSLPLFLAALAVASWMLRPVSRKLASPLVRSDGRDRGSSFVVPASA